MAGAHLMFRRPRRRQNTARGQGRPKLSLFNLPLNQQLPAQDTSPLAQDLKLHPIPIGKQSGSSNYKLSEVDRLLQLVEEYLPLGKDEWERLTNDYNATRSRSWNERDSDSILRKFKAMYGARNPSGKGNIPAHIERAKELKRAVDQKASVIEMDDCADEDSADEPDREDDEELEDKRPISPDFSFDFNPNEALFGDRGGVVAGPASGSVFAIAASSNKAPTVSEDIAFPEASEVLITGNRRDA
ncbi:hypothetical protein DVH05_006514 [Phytophthora capsici]|nr:hypothetical protein DVH05_006514 [Phytophthora capsici]